MSVKSFNWKLFLHNIGVILTGIVGIIIVLFVVIGPTILLPSPVGSIITMTISLLMLVCLMAWGMTIDKV